jgi:hypothetical protein
MINDELFDDGNYKYVGIVEQADVAQPFEILDTATGLRFFSVAAFRDDGVPFEMSDDTRLGSVFVGRVPVLYYPRNFDGGMAPFMLSLAFPWGGDIYGNMGTSSLMMLPVAPWMIEFVFDKIPGAYGYDITVTCNGKSWGNDNLLQSKFSGNKCKCVTDFVFEEGNTIFNISPYVLDIDGKKLYGEMRTMICYVRIDGWNAKYFKENAGTLNSPVFSVTAP